MIFSLWKKVQKRNRKAGRRQSCSVPKSTAPLPLKGPGPTPPQIRKDDLCPAGQAQSQNHGANTR